MTDMTPFERQVESELQGMVGPIPRFDAIEITETAAAGSRARRRWPKLFDAAGLAAATSVLLLVGVAILGQLLPNRPTDLVVTPDGSGDFVSVSEAVDAARHGDTVLVRPGVYRESVEVTKAIEIRGDGERDEIMFEVASDGPAFRLRGVDARIGNLSFVSLPWEDNDERRPVIWVDGGAPTIEDLVAHADVPEEFVFVRLYATDQGTVLRGNESSGIIRANRGARALIKGNTLVGETPAGITVERDDTELRVEGNTLNFVDAHQGSVELVGNDIYGGTDVGLAVEGGGSLGTIEYGRCGIVGSDALVMTSGQIHDTETAVCRAPSIVGGEIYRNGVGVWSDLGFGPESQDIPVTTVTGAVIRDNDIGVRTAPYSKIVLEDVELCGNGVDIDNHETSSVEQTGTGKCAP